MREIQLRDAKASLSAVVDEAMQGKPAVITRHGKRQVVVVSYEEWERLSHVPTFGRLLMSAPLKAAICPAATVRLCGNRVSDLPCTSWIPTSFQRRHRQGRCRFVGGMDGSRTNSLFLSVVTVAEIEDGIAKLDVKVRGAEALTFRHGWKRFCISMAIAFLFSMP